MSPIGRIFVVLNLILSACFLGWAANALASVHNYKGELEDAKSKHTEELAAKDKEIDALRIEKNGLSDAQRQFREERDLARADVDRLTSDIDELKRANEKMQGNLTEIQAALKDYNQTITQLSQQKDAAIEKAHEAERARDEALQKALDAEMGKRDAEEATKGAQLQIGDLEMARTELQEQLSRADARIKMMIARGGPEIADLGILMPQIEGSVVSVNPDLDLVVLNRGSKDGVQRGFKFDIYRGSQFKGRVRIQDVNETMSSGLIEYLDKDKVIASGDRATTSL
jgi:prefoldin subunit 5